MDCQGILALLFLICAGIVYLGFFIVQSIRRFKYYLRHRFSYRYVAESGNLTKLAKKYLNSKKDLNVKDSEGATLLYVAAESGNIEVVQWLVLQGADVNAKGKFNETALHAAAKNDHARIVQWLVEHGADINAKTELEEVEMPNGIVIGLFQFKTVCLFNSGDTALHLAESNNNLELVEWLVKYGAKE